MKKISPALATLSCLYAAASLAGAAEPAVSLSHDPLVIRVSNDEFRIAFGLKGEGCIANGCNGLIRYRVDWKSVDGRRGSETRRVAYVVSPQSARTIAVDRQYFHSGEGRGTTEIVKVKVSSISVIDGMAPRSGELAKL